MTTTNFESEQLLAKVMPHVNGCAVDLAVDAIRDGAIEFCQRTEAWVYDHADIDIVANTADYDLSPPSDTKVEKVLWGWYKPNGRRMYWKGQDNLARIYRDWRTQTSTEPTYITDLDLDANMIKLVPIPTVAASPGVGVLVVLKPTRTSAGMDSKLVDEYLETIAEGALYRLFMHAARYGDGRKAGAFMELFRRHTNVIYNRVQRGLGRDNAVTMSVPLG